MPGQPRVLLVGHDASRTGAPAMALALVRWLVATSGAEVAVTLVRGGPLAHEFRVLAATRVLDEGWRRPLARASEGLAALGAPVPATRALVRARHGATGHPDLVVANTLAALPVAAGLAGSARLTCWVHELDGVADRTIAPPQRAALLDRVDHLVAAGGGVGAMVVERWGFPADRVTVVDEYLDDLAPARRPVPASPAPGAALDVLGAGSLVPRKGLDGFVAALDVVSQSRPGLRAAWAGGPADGPVAAEVAHDLAASGAGGRVRLLGDVADLGPWWPTAGVLLHAPREDPFPLVAIEAAAQGVPVVTWDTGGAADLVRRAGLPELVAPAGDVLGLARRVAALLDDEAARRRAGAALRRVVDDLVSSRWSPVVWSACAGPGAS